MIDGGVVAIAHTPTGSAVQTTAIVALGNCATNMNLRKANTNKIVVSDPNNKIKSLVFNNTGSGALPPSKTCDVTNSWAVTGLDAATVGSFTCLNLIYNPADVTVGVENVIAVTSYDMSSICTIFT